MCSRYIFTENCKCGKEVSWFTSNKMCSEAKKSFKDCKLVDVILRSTRVECAECEEEGKKKENHDK